MQGQPQYADIAVITSGSQLAWTQINALRKALGSFPVLEIGEPVPAKRGRGPFTALSQMATSTLLQLSRGGGQAKIDAIIKTEGLKIAPELDQHVMRFRSADMERFRDTLRQIGPQLVFVIDAGELTAATLNSVRAPFIRYAASVNPAASEAYGGYFALAAGDEAGFGASLHVIDPDAEDGIGPVVAQQPTPVGEGDNIHTYPWRIAAHSRVMCVVAVREALEGRMTYVDVDLPSPAFQSPPLGRYLGAGLTRGVW